jgi:hypothetical protein
MPVYSEVRMKPTNTHWGQNADVPIVKAGGTLLLLLLSVGWDYASQLRLAAGLLVIP